MNALANLTPEPTAARSSVCGGGERFAAPFAPPALSPRRLDREIATFPNDFALDDISLEMLSGVPAGEREVPDSSLGILAALPGLVVGLHWLRSARNQKNAA